MTFSYYPTLFEVLKVLRVQIVSLLLGHSVQVLWSNRAGKVRPMSLQLVLFMRFKKRAEGK